MVVKKGFNFSSFLSKFSSNEDETRIIRFAKWKPAEKKTMTKFTSDNKVTR